MRRSALALRVANDQDLDAVNAVIERATMGWDLPERVKRLSLATYRCTPLDHELLELMVAEGPDGNILGVAAWERADPRDTPAHRAALLLHGIYVAPRVHHRGIGSQLLQAAEAAARRRALAGVLVKAQRGAEGFFTARGFHKLPVEDPERDYPHRYWKDIAVS